MVVSERSGNRALAIPRELVQSVVQEQLDEFVERGWTLLGGDFTASVARTRAVTSGSGSASISSVLSSGPAADDCAWRQDAASGPPRLSSATKDRPRPTVTH